MVGVCSLFILILCMMCCDGDGVLMWMFICVKIVVVVWVFLFFRKLLMCEMLLVSVVNMIVWWDIDLLLGMVRLFCRGWFL